MKFAWTSHHLFWRVMKLQKASLTIVTSDISRMTHLSLVSLLQLSCSVCVCVCVLLWWHIKTSVFYSCVSSCMEIIFVPPDVLWREEITIIAVVVVAQWITELTIKYCITERLVFKLYGLGLVPSFVSTWVSFLSVAGVVEKKHLYHSQDKHKFPLKVWRTEKWTFYLCLCDIQPFSHVTVK